MLERFYDKKTEVKLMYSLRFFCRLNAGVQNSLTVSIFSVSVVVTTGFSGAGVSSKICLGACLDSSTCS